VERRTPTLGLGAEPEIWMHCCNETVLRDCGRFCHAVHRPQLHKVVEREIRPCNAGRIPKGRLLFTTQIRENFPSNFGFFREKGVSTVELRRQADGGVEMLSALTLASNKAVDGAFSVC